MTRGHFLSCNFTERGVSRNGAEFTSEDLVKLIKGEIGIARYAPKWVRVDGQPHKLSNRADALDIFGRWGANVLRQAGLESAVLVPVPSSKTTKGHIPDPWPPWNMVESIRVHLPSVALWHGLRLIEPMDSWRETNRRDREALAANLHCALPLLNRGPHVLVDDAFTTGGHAQVCEAELTQAGAQVALGLFASRTVIGLSKRPSDPFLVPAEDF